ncbi:ABC transporter permease [alpha proteobacterium AAP81b]|nr:ABC transporter permease [alpha proteobacterium AAP81b]
MDAIATPPGPAAPTDRPLAVPIFRAVWIASLVSNFGSMIQSVGASWSMIAMGASPHLVALVQASTTLPIMLLALAAGAIADNRDRRQVMLAAQLFMFAVSALLAAASFMGALSPWALLGFTFLIGCGSAFNAPAWQASVGDMVPRPAVAGAVALNSINFNVARSLGPAIGGAIVAAAGAGVAFLVNALTYLGLVTVLARWRPVYPPRTLPPESLGEAMAAGIRYVRMSPDIAVVLLRAGVFGLAASGVPAMMPLIARDLPGGGPLTYGALLGGFGVGAVAGGLASPRLRARFSSESLVRLSTAALVVGTAVVAASTTIWTAVPALMLAGAGWLVALSTFNVSVQLAAPRWVLARALALYQMAAFGGLAAGASAAGLVAEARGVTVALTAAAVAQAVSGLLGLVRPLPPLATRNLDLLTRWHEPATAVAVEPQSGPIVVTVEYRLAPGTETEFVALMHERRRIRRRDGARHWTLLRDLMEADLWIERYHVATWLDYVRHNQRRTVADADNFDALRALSVAPLVVHRRIERPPAAMAAMTAPPPVDPMAAG